MTDLLIPTLILLLSAVALRNKLDLYSLMQAGVRDGLHLLYTILPPLVILLAAVELFRTSGAMALLIQFLSPLCNRIGIPPEVTPLLLIRPLSGSAALAVATDLMRVYGVDSQIGTTAAVMLGSTETTFYAISVYFGAAKIQNTRHAVPAALLADVVGFTSAALTARFFL